MFKTWVNSVGEKAPFFAVLGRSYKTDQINKQTMHLNLKFYQVCLVALGTE